MKRTGTKALSWLLSLALGLSLVPGMSMTALATDNGKYREYAWNETSKTLSYEDKGIPENAITLTAESTAWADNGWYIVPEGGVTIGSRIAVTGTANLILRDGATLNASQGITVNSGNTLNIYAQSEGTGELSAGNTTYAAGIGGGTRHESSGTVNIHGGKITATGANNASGIGGALDGGNGEVNIYGGEVIARGKNLAAGIGGYSGKSGGTVSIYGGTVNASGSQYGTTGIGIGGTAHGNCVVHIYGGEVTATSEKAAAGIQGTVTIDGGTVTANGGVSDAISAYSGETSYSSNGINGTVTVNGGTVTAFGGNVTGNIDNYGGTIYACNGISGTVTISGGTVTATGGSHTGNSSGTTVKEKGFGGSLTIGDSMKVLGGNSADPTEEIEKSNDDYARFKYMLVKLGHVHSFTYEANDATITATCGSQDGCPLASSNYQATLVMTANDATYSGSAYTGASFTNNIPSVSGDTVGEIEYYKVSTQGVTTDGTKQTGAPTDAGYYYASVTLTSGGNTYPAIKAFTVAPKALTITGATLTARDYAEGNKDVTVSEVTFDNATLTLNTDYTATAVMADETAGDAKSATVTVTLTNNNYSLATNTYSGATVQINKIDYTGSMTASANLRGTNGATAEVTLPALPTGASYGAVTNDNTAYFTVGAVADGKVTVTAAKDFDQATESAAKTFTVAVSGATNYNDYSVTVTITPIFKAEQTITAENVTATYGDTDKAVSATTSGNGAISYAVTSGDAVTVDASTGALTIKKAGTATVTVTAAETDDYAAATKDVTVTVNKKAVTVTADNKSMTVGSTAPVLTSTVTGLVGSDQEGVLTVSLECGYEPDTPGTYTIVASGEAEQGNYTVTYQNGTLTISRRPSSGGGTPTTTTVTVPVSGDDETVNVTVRVSGDTATVTGANVDKVLEAEDVGTVTIDVSTLKQNVTEVSIPGTMVKKIADAVADESNNADGLEIKLPTGTVTFDGSAVAAISEQANGKDLRLNLEDIGESKLNTAQKSAVEDMDVQEVLDAYMTAGGQRIRDFKGGKATVTVSYELKEGQTGRGVIVWYVADNGDKTEMPSTYDGKDVKFTVEHFSNYVIAYDAERAAACPRDETCPVSAFTDTDPGAWYHDGVHYALEKGLMNGVGDNRFDPNGTASRGMIVTILYRMENEPEVAAENPFGDVVDGQWYTNAVIWAAENKIVDGYGGGKFGPNDHITREQLVTVMYRYARYKGVDVSAGEDTNILSYDDAFDVSEWAIPAMQWAVGSGAVGGRTNTTLNPKDTATRAEAATIIMRYCTEIAK